MGDRDSAQGPGRQGSGRPTETGTGGLDDLFEDLEQQAAGIHLAERDAELVDRARGEYAAVAFSSRVHASLGRQVSVRLSSGQVAEGTLQQAGVDWCMVESAGRQGLWLLRLGAVAAAFGMSSRAVPEEARPAPARLSFGSALHRLAQESPDVLLLLVSGLDLRVRVVRIGADFVEARPVGSSTAGPSVALVPLTAVAGVTAVRPG